MSLTIKSNFMIIYKKKPNKNYKWLLKFEFFFKLEEADIGKNTTKHRDEYHRAWGNGER